MAVPKGKVSKARKNARRSAHWKLEIPSIVKCPRCQKMMLSHHVCKHCGYYKGQPVVKMDADEKKGKENTK